MVAFGALSLTKSLILEQPDDIVVPGHKPGVQLVGRGHAADGSLCSQAPVEGIRVGLEQRAGDVHTIDRTTQ